MEATLLENRDDDNQMHHITMSVDGKMLLFCFELAMLAERVPAYVGTESVASSATALLPIHDAFMDRQTDTDTSTRWS